MDTKASRSNRTRLLAIVLARAFVDEKTTQMVKVRSRDQCVVVGDEPIDNWWHLERLFILTALRKNLRISLWVLENRPFRVEPDAIISLDGR
jgi:hypothetical protein